MIIHDLDLMRVVGTPCEHDSPLVVHANRMLARAMSAKGLKPVARRNAQIIQRSGVVEEPQFAQCDTLDARIDALDPLPVEQRLRVPIRE